jgi:hypothetical protein
LARGEDTSTRRPPGVRRIAVDQSTVDRGHREDDKDKGWHWFDSGKIGESSGARSRAVEVAYATRYANGHLGRMRERGLGPAVGGAGW